MNVLAGIIGGLILGILAYFDMAMMTVLGTRGIGAAMVALFVGWVFGIAIGVRAPSAVKAWRRILIVCAILAFMLPLAGLVFTGTAVNQAVGVDSHSVAGAAGAAIGGGLFSGFLGFVGFFVGGIFLIIGLLIGRDKQIVYTHAAPKGEVDSPATTTESSTKYCSACGKGVRPGAKFCEHCSAALQ